MWNLLHDISFGFSCSVRTTDFFFAGLKLSANFFIRKKLVDVETPNTRIKDT